MPSFEALDAIADAYNPTMGIVWIGTLASAGIARAWRVLANRTAFVVLGLIAIRALEIADYTTQAFAAIGLDYSSHSAIAALMALYLVALYPRYWLLWCGSLAAYVALMLYQGYHSMVDVVATILVAGLLIGMLAPWFWTTGSTDYAVSIITGALGRNETQRRARADRGLPNDERKNAHSWP